MKTTIRLFVRLLSVCTAVSLSLYSTADDRLTADFKKADCCTADSLYRLMLNSNVSTQWLNRDSRFCYYTAERPEGEGETTVHYLADTRKGSRLELFDTRRLAGLLAPLAGEDKVKGKTHFYLGNLKMKTGDDRRLFFTYGSLRLVYDIKNGTLAENTEPEEKKTREPFAVRETWKNHSHDSAYYIYAFGHNLYLGNPATGDTLRLTDDGEQFHSFALGGASMRDSRGRAHAIGQWIEGTHRFVAIREDKRRVGTLTLVNSLNRPRPEAVTYKFAMPGDKEVSQFEMFEVDADSGRIYPIDIARYPDQIIEMPRFKAFTQSGGNVYFIRKSRAQDQVDLCRLDTKDRTLKVLIHEECKPHLNEQLFSFHVLNGGRDILWWSERNGKGQYFLYDGEGRLRNAVTPPDFVSGEMVRIDTTARTFVFNGYGREPGVNPNYRFYYSVRFDGRGLTCLTPGNGHHEASLSPDGSMIVDRCSRMDMAPQHNIYNRKGKRVCHLADCDLSRLYRHGWRAPEVVRVMAADSVTPLYGVVYTPLYMKPGDKYPIISNPYPGPHTDLMPQAFTLDDNCNQSLAQLGFIVINFSYRGSNPYRGRDFYTHGYGNLRDYALADDKAVIRQIAERYPEADLSRVGIYGHSGGGFMATAALLTSPDFYKVGVAASGNHDNNIYTQWWGETFHGVQQQTDSLGNTTFSCHIPSNIELAGNLKGRLLLITGDMDNNVHPASTIRMADALIKAKKRFDMMIIPGADHGLGDAYYVNLIRYYFVEHLLGKPSDDIDMVKHN